MVRRTVAIATTTGALLLAVLAGAAPAPAQPPSAPQPQRAPSVAVQQVAPADTATTGRLPDSPKRHDPAGVTPPLMEFDRAQALAANGPPLSADETLVCGAAGPRRFLQELITDNPLQYKVPYRLGDVIPPPNGPTNRNGRQYLLSGTADGALLGSGDFPFDHPFGSDFNMDVSLDPGYTSLAQTAGVVTPQPQHTELSAGQFPHVNVAPLPSGTLWDDFSLYDRSNLQPGYVPQAGDRIIMQGRWVNDCGHPPFQTELHPFSFMAWARQDGQKTVSQGFYAPYREMQAYHPDRSVSDDAGNPNRYTLPNTYSFPQGLVLSLFRLQDAGPAPYTSIDHLESFGLVEANKTTPVPYWVCAPAGSSGQYVGANWDFVTRPGVSIQVYADHASGCVYVVPSLGTQSTPNPASVNCSLPWDFLSQIASAEAGTPVDIKAELLKYIAPQYKSRMDPAPLMNCYQPVQGPTVSANPAGQNVSVDAATESPFYGRIEVFRTDVEPSLPSVPSSTSSSTSSSSTSSSNASTSSTPAGQTLTVTPATVEQGGTVNVQSSGWAPGATVTVSLDGTTLGTLVADPSGKVSGSFTVPSATSTGSHSITVAGTGNDGKALTISTAVTVSAATGGTGTQSGSLPLTGSNVARYVAIGCALVLFGLGLVALGGWRRRRQD